MSLPAKTQHKSTIIVAAISSRPYVLAAKNAGFDVIAIDAFADKDTKQAATQMYIAQCDEYQFELNQIVQILQSIDLSTIVGFCYGAGFERKPDILTEIAHYCPVLGNSVDAVMQSKSPQVLSDLCTKLNVNFPQISTKYPSPEQGWLQKKVGGSGGAHVVDVLHGYLEAHTDDYYQKKIEGTPISCLFLACDENVQVIGFNEQWVECGESQSYRYGGGVSQVSIPMSVKLIFERFVQGASKAFGLVGLNSCDAILSNDDLYILEINPRLSASIDLYQPTIGNLMAAHINACRDRTMNQLLLSPVARAHQVVYANSDTLVHQSDWPDWVADIPHPQEIIAAGTPICSVFAEAGNYMEAKQLVKSRASSITLNR